MNSIQFPLLLWNNNSEFPPPLKVASTYNFPLQYHDTEHGRYYSIRDWIAGLGVCGERGANHLWNIIKYRAKQDDREFLKWCMPLKYTTRNNKRYFSDFAHEKALFEITHQMKPNAIRNQILGLEVPKKKTSGFIYMIHVKGFEQFKIGYATDFDRRFTTYRRSTPPLFEWVVDVLIPVAGYISVEQKLHRVLSAFSVVGEWYAFPRAETKDNLVEWLKSLPGDRDITDNQFFDLKALLRK